MWEGSAPQPCFHVPATELGPGEGSRGTGGSSLTICEHSGGTEGLLGSGLAAVVVTPIRDLGTVRGISWIMPGWGWIMPRESHPFSMAVAPPHVHIP